MQAINLKNLGWLLAFLLLSFVGDRVGGWSLKHLTSKSQFRYSRMYQGMASSDLVFLGNSRGLSFYQPYIEEKTGQSTFNLSYNGLPMDLGRVLLQDYLKQYPKPKQILIDISMCDRENPKLVGQFTAYQPYSTALQSLIYEKNKQTARGAWISHLFRYNNELFHRALFYLKQPDKRWLLDRIVTNSLIEKVNRASYSFDLLFENTSVKELAALVEYLRQEEVSFHLVVNPYYPEFRRKMTDLDDLIQAVEEETGVEVHDYSMAIDKPEAFGDLQHLNVTGAKLYIDLLTTDGILQDK